MPPENKPEPQTGFLNSLKDLGTVLGNLSASAVESTSALLDQTETGRKAKELGGKAADIGTKVVSEASDTAKKIGANLSGEDVQRRVEELLEQQRRYNDILATRLAEALDRIEKLEQQVAKLSHER